jgi:hypothetical protein
MLIQREKSDFNDIQGIKDLIKANIFTLEIEPKAVTVY